jgi:hypothetical protein
MSLRDAEAFRAELLTHMRNPAPDYGGNVIRSMELYRDAQVDERRSFQDALELLLTSDDAQEREFGVTLCLGFFVFRDAI